MGTGVPAGCCRVAPDGMKVKVNAAKHKAMSNRRTLEAGTRAAAGR